MRFCKTYEEFSIYIIPDFNIYFIMRGGYLYIYIYGLMINLSLVLQIFFFIFRIKKELQDIRDRVNRILDTLEVKGVESSSTIAADQPGEDFV